LAPRLPAWDAPCPSARRTCAVPWAPGTGDCGAGMVSLYFSLSAPSKYSRSLSGTYDLQTQVYASSMVILHAARHHLPVPWLARWMLALGITASLAVNVAQGWSHGLVGAAAAAWPAVALVGSYELLAWVARTAAPGGPGHVPGADRGVPAGGPAGDHPAACRFPDARGRASGWVRRRNQPRARQGA
jgi:hypothetical protein